MSFRKRGDVLGGPQRGLGVNRGISSPDARAMRGLPQGRGLPPNGEMHLGERAHPIKHVSAGMRRLAVNESVVPPSSLDQSHPGIRPSPVSSQPTTSTGCHDLDKLLGHMGLPLGESLLIEEQGTTEFSSVLAKSFASQGIVHNRTEKSSALTNGNTHLIVVTLNQLFGQELPGVYKGSRKDIKKSKISETESKVTVQNMLESTHSEPSARQDLKIAWRYGLNDDKKNTKHKESENDAYPDYCHSFDITSRLMPAPNSAEISYISSIQPVRSILSQLESTINKFDRKLIRIVIPNFLHPAMYPPKSTQLTELIPLLHGIRSVVKKYKERTVLLCTMSSDLFSSGLVLPSIEIFFDSIINLEPFQQEMLEFLERAYKSQPNKVQHGLLHVLKLPILSERGEMHVMKSEWAFKNGKKKFEIEPWGIPVEDTDPDDSKHSSHNLDSQGALNSSGLDF
ncbi:LAFE_0G14994g1_1 [Lachancea fermentati]|uniref:Elongator complex protein 4 n=1 Tax=Lachancea fermentati TaxID=4955 RepID=A0A1G4MII0_LACFM|nr:LAFE_0G14994g1_1 [Lachancea fermentati]